MCVCVCVWFYCLMAGIFVFVLAECFSGFVLGWDVGWFISTLKGLLLLLCIELKRLLLLLYCTVLLISWHFLYGFVINLTYPWIRIKIWICHRIEYLIYSTQATTSRVGFCLLYLLRLFICFLEGEGSLMDGVHVKDVRRDLVNQIMIFLTLQ